MVDTSAAGAASHLQLRVRRPHSVQLSQSLWPSNRVVGSMRRNRKASSLNNLEIADIFIQQSNSRQGNCLEFCPLLSRVAVPFTCRLRTHTSIRIHPRLFYHTFTNGISSILVIAEK